MGSGRLSTVGDLRRGLLECLVYEPKLPERLRLASWKGSSLRLDGLRQETHNTQIGFRPPSF